MLPDGIWLLLERRTVRAQILMNGRFQRHPIQPEESAFPDSPSAERYLHSLPALLSIRDIEFTANLIIE